jgi:excisionase family DNA binding protein
MSSNAAPSDESLLTTRQVAKRMEVTAQTVRNLTIRDGLRFIRIGRELRFKREWVEDYIDRHEGAAG